MIPRAPARVLLAAAIVWSAAARAGAQSPPIQIGADFSGLNISSTPVNTRVYGVGARVDVSLTGRLDVESRLTWFPSAVSPGQTEGGRTFEGAFGVRGRFIDRRRVSFYGGLWPGFLHFTNIVVGARSQDLITGGATHFALDTGLGAEFNLTDRWAVHGELSGPLYAVRSIELFRSAPGPRGEVLSASLAPQIASPWQVSVGGGYRIRPVRRAASEEPVRGRWEIGGGGSRATTMDGFGFDDILNLAGVAGFSSLRIAPGIYADGALTLYPREVRIHTPFTGGRLAQALAGAKLGVRTDGYGLFGKVRVGTNSYSEAAVSTVPLPGGFARYNALAVDLGGVFERYIGGRWLIRFDGGDVLSVFRPTDVKDNGAIRSEPAPPAAHSIQLTIGAGWRFEPVSN